MLYLLARCFRQYNFCSKATSKPKSIEIRLWHSIRIKKIVLRYYSQNNKSVPRVQQCLQAISTGFRRSNKHLTLPLVLSLSAYPLVLILKVFLLKATLNSFVSNNRNISWIVKSPAPKLNRNMLYALTINRLAMVLCYNWE